MNVKCRCIDCRRKRIFRIRQSTGLAQTLNITLEYLKRYASASTLIVTLIFSSNISVYVYVYPEKQDVKQIMSALDKILKKAKEYEKKGRWDMVQYYLDQAIRLARLNDDTEYLPSKRDE